MLGLVATTVSFTAFPMTAFAWVKGKLNRDKVGFVVRSGEGRRHGSIRLKGVNVNILDVKISGKDTGGDLAILEQTGLTPGKGTPLHVHTGQDEIFKIIEGEYYFQVAKEKYRLLAGDTIFLPREVPHAWTQISEQAKMNVIVQPAGLLEEFFVALAAFEGEPTQEQVAKIFASHGMQVVGPPLKTN